MIARSWALWSVCLAMLLAARPARAQTVDLDQVLSVLAEVVEDRARLVASQTIKRQLVGNLCGRRLKLNFAQVPGNAGGERLERILFLGGETPGCKERASPCTSDDVFVESCRLAGNTPTGNVPLTDPYFLKTLGRETVGLAVRLSAFRLDRARFDRAGLNQAGTLLYEMMDVLSQSQPALDDVAEPILAFADRLSDNPHDELLMRLAQLPETQALLTKTKELVDAQCTVTLPSLRASKPPAGTNAAQQMVSLAGLCDTLQRHPIQRDVYAPGGANARACAAFIAGKREREAAFHALFEGRSASPATDEVERQRQRQASLLPYLTQPCVKGAVHCASAQLALRLADGLQSLGCRQSGEHGRVAFRQMGYLLAEAPIYMDAIAQLAVPGDTTAAKVFPEFTGRLPAVFLSTPIEPREEISTGVRIIGTALRAQGRDAEDLRRWLALLDRDARYAQNTGSINTLLASDALNWSEREQWPLSVRQLRDAVKDFIALPRFIGLVRIEEAKAAGTDQALRSMADLIQELVRMAQQEPHQSRLAPKVAKVFSLLEKLASAMEAHDEARKDELRVMSLALGLTAECSDLADRRDWIGLAFAVDRRLAAFPRYEGVPSAPVQMGSSLRFIRTLMAVHQASSPEEGKAIFASALDSEAGREQRYAAWTVDINALFAVRGGHQWNGTAKEGTEPASEASEWLGGLYAPIGVQVASGGVGATFYPVDLGSYLVAREGGEAPTPAAAIRFGGAFYGRPWSDIPVVFGAGYDYRPPFESYAEHRISVFAALELPLFVLH